MTEPDQKKDADADFDKLPITMRDIKRLMSCLVLAFIGIGLLGLLGCVDGARPGPISLHLIGIGLWGLALLFARWFLKLAEEWEA